MPFLDDQDYQAHGYQVNIVGTDLCVPYSWNGYQFPQGVRAGTEPFWDAVLDAVVPHIQGGIHPDGPEVAGTWGAENRQNVNDPSRASFHGGGLALDVNAPWNGNGAGWQDGKQWGVPSAIAAIVRELGGLAGGEWGDAMHIECHLTLEEIAERWPAGNTTPAPPAPTAPPTPVVTLDLLEQIMTLTGAPTDYKTFLIDVATAVTDQLSQLQSTEQRNPAGLAAGVDDAANAVNHGEDWDHSPSVTPGMSPAEADRAVRR